MTPFATFSSVAASIDQSNINTDAIIPGAYLRSPSADLAQGLFTTWRYDDEGRERPDFVLNRESFRQAQILIGGPNFGCGSSREAAVWALVRFGVRAVFASKFADIFYENAFRNGLLPALMNEEELVEVRALADDGVVFTVDLEALTLAGAGHSWSFAVPGSRRAALLRGDDEIEATLRFECAIDRFEAKDRNERGWAYRSLPPAPEKSEA